MTTSSMLRAVLVGGATVLLAAAGVHENARRTETEAALGAWTGSEVAERHPDAAREIERELDPVSLRLRVGRAVLADALDAQWLDELPPEQAADAAGKLRENLVAVEGWAAAALDRRPLSWEAALLLGGARFLTAWRGDESSVYLDPEGWREPLRAARELAPSEPEPARLLATAALVAWPGLSDADRRLARDTLRQGFGDPGTLRLLLPEWRAAAPDEETFEGLLPDLASTWTLLMGTYGREGAWESYCRIRGAWWETTIREGRERLGEAQVQLSQGDPHRARRSLLGLVADLPIDRRTLPLFERTIERLPPGPVGPGVITRLEAWLRWGLPLTLLDAPTLSPRSFGRLASLGAGSLPLELEAWAWLAAGETQLAAEAEARSDRSWSEEWAPYLLAKASRLAEEGHEEEAMEALGRVHRSRTDEWEYRALSHDLGLRGTPPEASLERSGTAWRWRGAEASLGLVLPVEAARLALHVDDAPIDGGALLVALDGREEACAPARGGERIAIPVELSAGPHLARVEPAGSSRIVPGDVRALPR